MSRAILASQSMMASPQFLSEAECITAMEVDILYITRDEYFFSLCVFAPCYSADFGPRLPCKIIINNVEIRQVRRKIHPC